MIWRYAWKEIKRSWFLYLIVAVFMSVTLVACCSVVSSVNLKLKRYLAVSPYLEKKGVMIFAMEMFNPDTGIIVRDSKELRELLPDVQDVIAVSKLWDPYFGDERPENAESNLNVWSYNTDTLNIMDLQLAEGRWFTEEDTKSDILKGVISYNRNDIKTGDIITVKQATSVSQMQVEMQVEIIGVIKDKENIAMSYVEGEGTGDYRDIFTSYIYDVEDQKPLLILQEEQFLENEGFPYLDFRKSKSGFLKAVTQLCVLTYGDDVTDDKIKDEINYLYNSGSIMKKTDLKDIRSNSREYIRRSFYADIPITVCLLVFVIVSMLGVSAVLTKRNLRTYAIYYLCGRSWKFCSGIGLAVAVVLSGFSILIALGNVLLLQLVDETAGGALGFGVPQALVCAIVLAVYIFFGWLLPKSIVQHTSAKIVFSENDN